MIPLPRDGWPIVRPPEVLGLGAADAQAETDARIGGAPTDRTDTPDHFMRGDVADMVRNIGRALREGLR